MRHRAFFYRPHRLTGYTVEHVGKTRFPEHHNGIDSFPVHSNGREDGCRRYVVVPQAMVHRLKVPYPLAGVGIQTDDGFREEIVSLPPATVIVVARRTDGEVHQPSLYVDRERRPDVGVADVAPRVVFPGFVAELAWLRSGVEAPHPFSSPHVERLHVARWVVLVGEAVADTVADDHQVLIHNRWRRVGVVKFVHLPDEVAGEVDLAAAPKAGNRRSSGRIQSDESPTAVDEHASLLAVCPCGHTSVHEPGSVGGLTPTVGARIVAPELGAGFGIECNDTVVGCAQEQSVVDHQRSNLEVARVGGLGGVGIIDPLFVGPPFPGHRQVSDVVSIDRG